MKINHRKFFLITTVLIFLFFVGLTFVRAYTSLNDPVETSLSASEEYPQLGEYIVITIYAQDDDGVKEVCLRPEGGSDFCESCLFDPSPCVRSWKIKRNEPGDYTFYGQVFSRKSDGTHEVASTDPDKITITFGESSNSHDYKECYNNDVYWFDYRDDRQEKYQECGSDYCKDWGSEYCHNGDVYRKRTCYEKGCDDGACYSDSYTRTKLVEECESDETCRNGECVEEDSCECSKGSCCDGCDYKPSTAICDFKIQTQYGCPWGTGCGRDVGKRTKTKFKYCSGDSAQCDGEWSKWSNWTNWRLADYCSTNEVCSVGKSQCQYRASCVQPASTYNKYYRKDCYDNDIYWFDSNGLRQDKYRECLDDNSCTLDGCENNDCFNNLKCDGTTCEIGSIYYCENCEHCGDDICNCQENNSLCPEDCQVVKSEEPEKGIAAVGLTLKSLIKKWYVWLLLWLLFVFLLYQILKRGKGSRSNELS